MTDARPAEAIDFMYVIEELKEQRNDALNKAANVGGQLRAANQQVANANQTIQSLVEQLQNAQAAIADLQPSVPSDVGDHEITA